MKKLLIILLFIPFVSSGQVSNNEWEKLNKKSAVTYLKKKGYQVDISAQKTNDGELTSVVGINKYNFNKGSVNVRYTERFSIYFLNGSAVTSNQKFELSRNNILSGAIGNDVAYNVLKPLWVKVIENHRKEFLDFRNKWYNKYIDDKVIIDTKDEYETKTIESEGYRFRVKASISVRDDGLSLKTESTVWAPQKEYLLGGVININEVNNYDIPAMISAFIVDFKYYILKNNIAVDLSNINKGKLISKFQALKGAKIALAMGLKDDNRIEILIDPEKWKNSSSPKRWYILYHELGHDILNLEHGNGGKMMFNFADRDYNFMEFFTDKNYMFNHYGLIKGYKPNTDNTNNKLAPEIISEDPYVAIEGYTKAIKLNPNDVSAYIKRGLEKNSIGDLNGACIDWRKALELGSESAVAVLKAMKCYESKSDDPFFYKKRGEDRKESKDYKGAIADFTKVIEIDKLGSLGLIASALDERGTLKLLLKDNYGAIADFTRIIDMKPNHIEVLLKRGAVKHVLKDYYGAIIDFSKVIKLNPNNSTAYLARGAAKEELGDSVRSCLDYKKAAELGSSGAKFIVKLQCK